MTEEIKNNNYTNGYKEPILYSGVRGIAVKILNRIDRTDAYLDKILEIELKNSELSGVDKALLFEIVHGVIRWLNRIDWILNGFYKGQFSKCIPNVKNTMRVALYQILFLDKVPDYAAVNEAVEFVKKLQGQKPADLTNAVLRNIIKKKDAIRYPDREEDIAGYFSSYYSHPSWLVKRWINRWGAEFTEKLLISNNEKPNLVLRINKLVTSKDEFKDLLQSVNLGFVECEYIDGFIKLNNLTNISDWEYFSRGYFSIQDESTGLPCKLMNVKPGMRVLDFCAAPGGKTGMLADLMNNEGTLVAIDKFESRLKILNKNLERLKVKNVEAIAVDALEFNSDPFDRILVDVPCSGLGTLTKKPDIKWKRDIGDFRKLNSTQSQLLEAASKLVKPGGYLVYSTCTIEPEENFEIIEKFLMSNLNFEISFPGNEFNENLVNEKGYIQSFPHIHGIDGAFAIRLMRKS